jgi:hypothetical protein
MRKSFLDERMAPELLPYATDLIDRVRDLIRTQVHIHFPHPSEQPSPRSADVCMIKSLV